MPYCNSYLCCSGGRFTDWFALDRCVAVAAAALFGCAYAALATTRRELRNNSRPAEAYTQQLKALQEGWAPLSVLLHGSQATYTEIYRQIDRPQRQLRSFPRSFPAMHLRPWAWSHLPFLDVFWYRSVVVVLR